MGQQSHKGIRQQNAMGQQPEEQATKPSQRAFKQRSRNVAKQQAQKATAQQSQKATGQQPQKVMGQQPQKVVRQQSQKVMGQQPKMVMRQQSQEAARQQPQKAARQQPQKAAGQQPQKAAGQQPQKAEGQQPQKAAGQQPQKAAGQQPQKAAGQQPKMAMRQQSQEAIRQKATGQSQEGMEKQAQEAKINNVNQINKSALVYVKDIAVGGFSSVYEMTWRSPEGPINVAAKRLNRKDKHELEVLSGLDHPNIVKLIGVVDEGMDFMLVLELCEGGSLRSYLQARNGRPLSVQQFFQWAEQAAKPLEYLRENKWVHKDVKSPNYMVTSQSTLKLGDFGLAKNIDQTVFNVTETASYQWMAPELLVKGVLSPKYDIFAFAVVLWEMWTVRFPWEGLENQVILWKVCNENARLPIPDDCPEPIKDLLRQCWQTTWQQRPDILQVIEVITATSRTVIAAAEIESSQKHIFDGPWDMDSEFGKQDGPGKLSSASYMKLSPDEDLVVIADFNANQMKIYNLEEGECVSSINTYVTPDKIAVIGDTCFMTACSPYITMYGVDGKCKGSWVSSCPNVSSPTPVLRGIATDLAGDLMLGDVENRFIYKYKQDGTHVGSIKVDIEPEQIAVTSQGTIVISKFGTAPQLISNTGLHTLEHPVDESKWSLCNFCCHKSIIIVVNLFTSEFLCYTESGKYLGCMQLPTAVCPRGIAMTSDSQTLLVCENESVKIYTRSHTWPDLGHLMVSCI